MWLSYLITFLSIVVGAVMILYQLGRQHKNELALQKENFREKLRLKIYQEFSTVLQKASKNAINAGMYAFHIPISLKNYLYQLNIGLSPAPIRQRVIEFSKLHNRSEQGVIKLIRLFEKYEVISPELNIFKLALNVASHDMREANTQLHTLLLQILPMDIALPNGTHQVMNVIRPTDAQLQQLEKFVSKYKKAEDDLCGYLYDLNVELQNIFLSKLFNNKVQRRQPLDPQIKVISTEPSEVQKLHKYFEEETDWGRRKRQAEQAVMKRLNNP